MKAAAAETTDALYRPWSRRLRSPVWYVKFAMILSAPMARTDDESSGLAIPGSNNNDIG